MSPEIEFAAVDRVLGPDAHLVVSSIAKEAAAHAVPQVLEALGFDIDHPLEVQKDMAHLRRWRKTTDKMKENGFKTMASAFILGLLGLVVLGFKSKIGFHD